MTHDRFFPNLYKRCLKSGLLEQGADAIQSEIDKMGVTASVEAIKMLSFLNLEGYRIQLGDTAAFFPRTVVISEAKKNTIVARMRKNFLEVDVVLPPYVAMGYLSGYAARIEKSSSQKEKESFIAEMLKELYGEPLNLADLCVSYKLDPCIAPFYDNIVEAIDAHFLGLRRASVLTLIPCIEGVIRNLAEKVGRNIRDRIDAPSFLDVLARVQKHYIKNVELPGIAWVPSELETVAFFDHFHELLQMVESIRVFVEHAMYKHTSDYDRSSQLNRHGIVHGLLSDYHTETNFYRLIVLLNGLSVASIVAGHEASLFHPEPTDEARKLASHFKSCMLSSSTITPIARL
ncbi:hypothetical protein GTP38_24375 [Duganella sp. FT94W]|uniref:Uncharacterized protein n=1 Tax=Duganella lactea TaxID=2692173 RepID=A0ABW9VD27_9BURK|nr:hypothetical protein [Duganella lactea]MYM37466.1 hypothetical protein [Duganella lactea]